MGKRLAILAAGTAGALESRVIPPPLPHLRCARYGASTPHSPMALRQATALQYGGQSGTAPFPAALRATLTLPDARGLFPIA
jgi:hypothetical protein